MNKMNLTQLRYFVEIAETGSFTRAAENLFISQPSLSVSIQKLEEDLGVKLFNRGKLDFLTSSGKYLLARAKSILAEIELLEIKLRKNLSSNKILKIGILYSLPIDSIVQIISNFSKNYPDILIEQINGSVTELEQWLEKNDIDLAISVSKEQKDGYIVQKLFSQKYQVTIPLNHHLAQKKTITFRDLDGLPYIERVQCEIKEELQNLFAAKKVLPKIVCRTADDQLSNNLVVSGKGVAVMPVRVAKSDILYLPFSDINLTRQICLISKFDHNLETINLFHEFASDYFKKNIIQ